jgi:hypothetical protein
LNASIRNAGLRIHAAFQGKLAEEPHLKSEIVVLGGSRLQALALDAAPTCSAKPRIKHQTSGKASEISQKKASAAVLNREAFIDRERMPDYFAITRTISSTLLE